MQAEVQKYNEVQCDKRNSYRRRIKADKVAGGHGDSVEDATASPEGPEQANRRGDGEHEPPTKKVRREAGDEVDVEEEEEDGDGEDGEDEGAEDEVDDEDDDAEEEAEDEDMDDAEESTNGALDDADDDRVGGEIRDEALDELDSD